MTLYLGISLLIELTKNVNILTKQHQKKYLYQFQSKETQENSLVNTEKALLPLILKYTANDLLIS